MNFINSNPKKDHFFAIPEWYPHSKSYMMWPKRPDNWRKGGKPAQKVFAEIASIISKYEPITMLVQPDQYQNARSMLSRAVRLVEMSYNDAWIRDIGPTYVANSNHKNRIVNWNFNAWGGLVDGLYFPWDQDDLVAQKLGELDELDCYDVDFVLEGCGFQTDGEGTLLVVEESVLSEGRNNQISKRKVETVLKKYLNINKIIWLKHGYFMDETNGDIDNMATFIRPGEIALNWTKNRADPMYQITHEAADILSNSTDAKGRHFKIHKVQLPEILLASEIENKYIDPVNGLLPRKAGDRLTASYINCYLANNAVILPIFNDPNDQLAIEQYQQLFPDRKIEPVYTRELLLGGGNIHSVVLGVPD
ncbi:agmatine deiminase [Xylocopilactobacillus apicola]|uniref:Putative agmatine deiminase n=1 Tax=Xylocopilactobacillus apicola TaxID=2932184 RepID=A0AAU9DQD3_9LACO|nr:agmatine deiminase [Xylocopilactobacillus apicola]BDR58084.1 putative agmatine deiminase 1 [Xylocopilactobacillus apicola]